MGAEGGEREGGGGFVSCYGRSHSASTVTLTGMTDLEDKDFKERDATFRQRTNLQEGGGLALRVRTDLQEDEDRL